MKEEKTGEVFGPSKIAAWEAVKSTLISRTIYLLPVFFVPAIWNAALKSMHLMPKAKTPLGNAIEATGVAIGLMIAMPTNCAFYP